MARPDRGVWRPAGAISRFRLAAKAAMVHNCYPSLDLTAACGGRGDVEIELVAMVHNCYPWLDLTAAGGGRGDVK